MPRWTTALRRAVGSAIVRVDSATLRAHGTDAWDATALPEAVVLARSARDVSRTLRFCSRHRIPVTARGAGRGYVGGCVPVHGGVVLSLAALDRILEISAADSIAIVEPGVITGDLQAAVERRGLCYPPDPASLSESSIGGNIATNAGGPRCLKYGVTRHYVLGLDVVLANGDLVRLGGRTHKNKTGLNLADLFIGSEGLLGVITRATLRLIPLPPARAALVATYSGARPAAAAVNRILRAGHLPSALEIADAFTLAAARRANPATTPPGNAFLLVEIDGQPAAVRAELGELRRLLRETRPASLRLAGNERQAAALWDLRRGFSYALRDTGLAKLNEDVVVPRSRLADLFGFAARLRRQSGYPIACFGHAGDGNIHVNVMVPPGEAGSAKARGVLDRLFTQVLAWGGALTGEHGIGLAKKPWWNQAVPPETRRLHTAIKGTLDPRHLLNPGKFIAAPD